jgi:hypothetical protein
MAVTLQRDPLVHLILGAAISVHRALGPGLFESIYRDCLSQELQDERLPIDRELILRQRPASRSLGPDPDVSETLGVPPRPAHQLQRGTVDGRREELPERNTRALTVKDVEVRF